ncbi:MAG: beta-ketoacyl-[acyl-carrier-protein] synthase family protein [Nitrospirae bacterium]|nr:beta-ketoacyl-[acyl-carrier-protein] synthase family protein [Nitrospirota bacterium]MBF0540049.1 beta-ketoacyl-[acyl-carrier-protein] synthase family protein [Nitrospirota bacterium]
MTRVVVTGIGALTPLGNTFNASWQGLIEGRSGIDKYFDILDTPYLSGRLRDFDPLQFMSSKEVQRLDPFAQYAMSAAHMAVDDASLKLNKHCAVIIGSSRGGIMSMEKSFTQAHPSPYLMPASTISVAASYIAQTFKLTGHCLGISNACSSGANAVGEAYRLIKHGYASTAICGGADAPICRVCLMGYKSSKVMSMKKSSMPFDAGRDGFILSEGACVLILEEMEQALSRGASIYGEIIGYVNSTDGFDPVRPDADAQAGAIKTALMQCGLDGHEIDFINAHAASTKIGDQTEALAINQVFGEVRVTANKSATGHMLAASGAFEIAATSASIKYSIIPPTINIENIDPKCNINVILQRLNTPVKTAISNSFGFGGLNAVIVLREFTYKT